MNLKEAIEYVVGLGRQGLKVESEEIEGVGIVVRDHNGEVKVLGQEEHVATLEVFTLQAVVDYLKANKDELDLDSLTVHVVAPDCVHVRGPIDIALHGDGNRNDYVWARPVVSLGHKFGHGLQPEDLITYLQTHFADAGQRAELLKLVGTITTGGVNTFADDGVTQEVTTKTGAARLGGGVLRNPYALHPLRGFPEVAPVPSPFIVRAQARGDALPTITLHECDGGIWKVVAIERTAEWLRKNLPEGPAVIA